MDINRKIHNLFHPKRGEVWMLHRVVEQRSEDPAKRMLEVTPEWLETKIEEYRQKGYTFISLDDLSSLKTPKRVCLTIDDGYFDTLTVALPLFRRLQLPFTVYLTTGFIDNRLPIPWYNGQRLGLSVEQVKELAANPLCTIGAHTVNHPRLCSLSVNDQRLEIETSKLQLETLLNQSIKHFAYPHGDYNAATVDICRTLGFLTAVTTSGRPVRTDSRPLELDRINILQP